MIIFWCLFSSTWFWTLLIKLVEGKDIKCAFEEKSGRIPKAETAAAKCGLQSMSCGLLAGGIPVTHTDTLTLLVRWETSCKIQCSPTQVPFRVIGRKQTTPKSGHSEASFFLGGIFGHFLSLSPSDPIEIFKNHTFGIN